MWSSRGCANPAVIDEARRQHAVAVAPLASPSRLVLARELQGLTQQAAVARARPQLSGPALSQIERGRTQPSASTLLALADVYGCPLEFFVDRPGDGQPEGFFRSLRSTTARDRRQQLARARLMRDFMAVVEDHLQLPAPNVPAYELDPRLPGAVEEAAVRVRDAWGLGDGPLDHVVRTMERNGIVVVRVDRFKNDMDAFSVNFPDRPLVVLGATKGVTARSRFDAAHELGHLVLHTDSDAGTKEAETQAHAFAAAFLMPASGIRSELPDRMDYHALMRLKVKWRVSIQALLMRARTLGVMSPTRYTSCMKLVSSRGWRIREPGDDLLGAVEAPAMLAAALEHLDRLGIGFEKLCSEGALPVEQVKLLLDRTTDPRPRLDL